jgi:hypothetical protein
MRATKEIRRARDMEEDVDAFARLLRKKGNKGLSALRIESDRRPTHARA